MEKAHEAHEILTTIRRKILKTLMYFLWRVRVDYGHDRVVVRRGHKWNLHDWDASDVVGSRGAFGTNAFCTGRRDYPIFAAGSADEAGPPMRQGGDMFGRSGHPFRCDARGNVGHLARGVRRLSPGRPGPVMPQEWQGHDLPKFVVPGTDGARSSRIFGRRMHWEALFNAAPHSTIPRPHRPIRKRK